MKNTTKCGVKFSTSGDPAQAQLPLGALNTLIEELSVAVKYLKTMITCASDYIQSATNNTVDIKTKSAHKNQALEDLDACRISTNNSLEALNNLAMIQRQFEIYCPVAGSEASVDTGPTAGPSTTLPSPRTSPLLSHRRKRTRTSSSFIGSDDDYDMDCDNEDFIP